MVSGKIQTLAKCWYSVLRWGPAQAGPALRGETFKIGRVISEETLQRHGMVWLMLFSPVHLLPPTNSLRDARDLGDCMPRQVQGWGPRSMGKEPCVGLIQGGMGSVTSPHVLGRPQPADLLLYFSAFTLKRLSFAFGVIRLWKRKLFQSAAVRQYNLVCWDAVEGFGLMLLNI